MDKILYKCDICGEIFVTSDEFLAHRMTQHTGHEPFKCKLCGEAFWDLVTLLCHEQTHAATDKTINKCNTCEKLFTTVGGLVCHMRIHTGERPYVCDVCQKTFTQSGHLQRHKRIHTGVKPYICDICQNAFIDLSTLIRHRRTHTGDKPYHCDICNKSFTQSSNFVFHKRIHSGERPYSCDICGKTFIRSCDLLCHKRTHTGEKPYTCETCNKSFSKSSSLIDHKRTHTGQKPYQCDTCGKAFVTSSHLLTHKRTHTGEKPYKCDICPKQFSTSSGLVCHKRIHTGDKPYRCDLCEKRFCQLSHLLSHKRRHDPIKLYKCDVCNEAFTISSNLLDHKKLNHKQLHSKESPYLCDICGQEFSDSSILAYHKRSHTREEELRCDNSSGLSLNLSDSDVHAQMSCTEIQGIVCQNMQSDCHTGTPSILERKVRDKCVKLEKGLSEHEHSCSLKSFVPETAEAQNTDIELKEHTEYNKTLVCSRCRLSFQSEMLLNKHVCAQFGKTFTDSLSPLEQKVSELIQKNTKCGLEIGEQNGLNSELKMHTEGTTSETTSHDSDFNSQLKLVKFNTFGKSCDENQNRNNSQNELEPFREYSDTIYVCSQCRSCFNSLLLMEKHCCVQINICKKEYDESNEYKRCIHTKEKQDYQVERFAGAKSITCVCSQCGCYFHSQSLLDEHGLFTHGYKDKATF